MSSSLWLREPLPALNDLEGKVLPSSLPPVIDAHVHLFPDRLFQAIWRWFEKYGWPIRYKLSTDQVTDFLFSRGVSRIVALHYAHKPGMARTMNQYMADVCRREPRVLGAATVFPGEPDAKAILEEAFALGLRAVKVHCHVQCVAADDASVYEIYEVSARHGFPVVIHAGREPASEHYQCDPLELCNASSIERALKDFPALKLVVPHLGAAEYETYERLVTQFDNLWLDTTMVVAEYFPFPTPVRLLRCRPERIMYGTDFPNIPYSWDREISKLVQLGIPERDLIQILGGTAEALYWPREPSARDA